MVVNPTELLAEIKEMRQYADITPERLWLSARSHVITPWHIHLDKNRENTSDTPLGTTKRGIGPTYSDKAARTGLRLGHFVKNEVRRDWIENMLATNESFKESYDLLQEKWKKFNEVAEELGPFVCDAENRLRKEIANGKRLLLEGAQGALLDIDHGTYPFVTFSSCSAGGAYASMGISPRNVSKIYGVAKAYLTRVGTGPFPTELDDGPGKHMATKGNEFGATTGRPRRCGWLDTVALRYAYEINGMDGVILNKLDILSGLDELKVCTAYEHPTQGRLEDFPWDDQVLSDCKPVYETFKGWQEDIPTTGKISDLPKAAQDYVAAIEKFVGGPVTMVGTGG